MSKTILKILLVFEPETNNYAEIGIRTILKSYPQAKISTLLDHTDLPDTMKRMVESAFFYRTDHQIVAYNDELPSEYDMMILFVQNPSTSMLPNLVSMTNTVKAGRRYILDCNFNVYRPRRYWYYRFRILVARVPLFLREPAFLFAQVSIGIKFVRRHVLRRFGLLEQWEKANVENTTANDEAEIEETFDQNE